MPSETEGGKKPVLGQSKLPDHGGSTRHFGGLKKFQYVNLKNLFFFLSVCVYIYAVKFTLKSV